MVSTLVLISAAFLSAAPTQGLSNGSLSLVPEGPGKWLLTNALSGLTFRLPVRKEWKGKHLHIQVFLFGEEVESIEARIYRVTPRKPFVTRVLEVAPLSVALH